MAETAHLLVCTISVWAAAVKPRVQLLLQIACAEELVLQVARPRFGPEVWPWTIRLQSGLSERNPTGEVLGRMAQSLLARDFVSHGDRNVLWCHVAPAAPHALAEWVVSVLAEAELQTRPVPGKRRHLQRGGSGP